MNGTIEKAIGQNIRRLRERAGVTQDYLATKLQLNGCDITRSAVAKIEVGQRHVYPDEIMLIKQILNVTYEEIFSLDRTV
ncbi:MAG: helix-turn-helix transcriptional regulator [Clostridia bacterium]|jgi:transcriptional regulator with XRE-family HTH domain|nr:helix-turn-helix transcriptional regulator [Clostridia bacterium]